jgi:tetratricopeptide (TPR) repeat protein
MISYFQKIALCIVIVFSSMSLYAKLNYRQFFQDSLGRKEWAAGNYEQAEIHFRENAINNPNVGQFHFNRGAALYRTEHFEEAAHEFQMALYDRNFADKDMAYHNLGNIAFRAEEYDKALDFYRRSLVENQHNMDSRKNWEMTRLIMQQEQSEQSQDDDNDDENDDNEEQQQPQQPQPQQPQELTPDQREAERILNALEQKQEQERIKEDQGVGIKTGNFW